MTINPRAVMQKAWSFFRALRDRMSFADALRAAWAVLRGKVYCWQASYVDWSHGVTRTIGFGKTADEVHAACISERWAMLRKGLRSLGSNEFNIEIYARTATARAA